MRQDVETGKAIDLEICTRECVFLEFIVVDRVIYILVESGWLCFLLIAGVRIVVILNSEILYYIGLNNSS